MTVTMVVMYKEPSDREKFDKYYFDTHIPLAQKMPGVLKAEVSRFTGRDTPYYLMATFYFNNKEERKAALASPEGQAVNADVANFATPDIMTVAFADIV